MSVRHKPSYIFWRGKDQGERKKIGWRNEEKSQKQRAGDNIWMMSLLVCSLVCVQARHKPGISAAVTFPEPEFESTTGDCEVAQMLLLLLWSHDPCVWIATVFFFFKQRFRQAFICGFVAEFTLIQTSALEWFIIFRDPLILNIITTKIPSITCDIPPLHLSLQLWKALFSKTKI